VKRSYWGKKRKKKGNRNYIRGRAFEYRVMKKFFQWPYVKRHFASKGIADIVCIRALHSSGFMQFHMAEVAFIQCKFGVNSHRNFPWSKREELKNYAKDCGAIPIFAFNENRKIKLINLDTNKEFIP
jgi:hypothetical protein